jgi:Ras family protein T1
MTTLSNHQTTLKYLAYLGFEGDTRTALKVTRPRKADRKKGKIQRGVFLCYVVGAPGAGKVTIDKKREVMNTDTYSSLLGRRL